MNISLEYFMFLAFVLCVIISCVTLLVRSVHLSANFVFIVIKEIRWSNIKNTDEKN